MKRFRHHAAAALLCAAAVLPAARAAQQQRPERMPPTQSPLQELQVPPTAPCWQQWPYQMPLEGPPQPQLPPDLLWEDSPPNLQNPPPLPVVTVAPDAGMTVVTYSVADLVVPVDAPAKGAKPLDEVLLRLITQTVAPESWSDNGGRATIQYFPLGMAVVVRQNAANQQHVAELLESLRKLQDVEVAVEIRMVTVSPEVGKAFKTLAGFEKHDDGNSRRAFEGAFLNDKQMLSWFQLFQSDRATNVLQAPKLTLCNAQHASLQVGDEAALEGGCNHTSYGLRANVLPVVSADHRSVRLHLDLAVADGCSRLTIDKVLVVPSGGTMVCSLGRTTVDTTMQVTVPQGCWTNTGTQTWTLPSREERETFLLVTPRVVVTPQQEQVFQFYTGFFN